MITATTQPEKFYTPPSDHADLTEDERQQEDKLARYLRRKDRGERKRAGTAIIRANRRARLAHQRARGRNHRDDHYHQRALAARLKVTNPDRKLTSAWRAYTLFSAAASLVAIAAIIWCSVTVGQALDIGFAGYMVEGLFSVLLVVSLGAQVYATRYGRPMLWWQYLLDGFLLMSSLVLNVVPWGAKTNWSEPAQLPAHALPPLALVAAVAMQYVLSKVFGGILMSAELADHYPDQVEQSSTEPDHMVNLVTTGASGEDQGGATEPTWSDTDDSLPDQVEQDGRDGPDHPDPTPTATMNTQVTDWSDGPDRERSSMPTNPSPAPHRTQPIGHNPTTPATTTASWSGTTSTAPALDHPTMQIPTISDQQPDINTTEDMRMYLRTKGMSHDDIADLLAPVAEALMAEDDFISRADVTNLTDVNSSTTAGKIQQLLKDRYPDHPDPTGRRKPDRTRTIAHAIASTTGQPYLQSVR